MTGTLIIAEAGVNHNGDLAMAFKLVDEAAAAGADIVKFQTFKAERIATARARLADYQQKNSPAEASQFDMLKRLELSEGDHFRLLEHCRLRSIKFLSTAFDLESLAFLEGLGMECFKIPSGEITNLPYLRRIGRLGRPLILSTGMAKIGEVDDAIGILEASGTPRGNITVLHCTTEYPAPFAEVNLSAMRRMGDAFGVKFGYSDHTVGIEVPIAAVALGATVIEKHFTLDKQLPGPDHRASLEPHELRAMVSGIRNVELAMGDGVKRRTPSEAQNVAVARKSIVALTGIKTGEIFSEDNLTTKRPGSGVSPMRWDEIVGRSSTRDYQPDELIEL